MIPQQKPTPAAVAAKIRRMIAAGGSVEHAKGVQWFFKEEIKSRGWYTAELRKAAIRFRRKIQKEYSSPEFLIQLANQLFSGEVLEEKNFAVFLLEGMTAEFTDLEFQMFQSWLDRITSWADHDALVHYLIAPMIVANPARAKYAVRWAKSPDRWHRRAACVALIQGTRRKMFFREIVNLSSQLLNDPDDIVQKGVAWLLRETAKAEPKRTIPYLMRIRHSAPRLVLRTACERLDAATSSRILYN